MKKDGKYRYLAKNTILFTISSFGSKILTFMLVPLYTNVLTTAEYGIADIISTSAILIGYIFTLNISDAILRYAIDDNDNAKKILAFGFKIILIGTAILCLVLAVIWKLAILSWDNYCYIFLVLYYFFFVLNSVFSNYLRAIDHIKAVAIGGILTTLVTIVSNIVFLLIIKTGLIGYLISMILGVFATCIYQMLVIRMPLINYFNLTCSDNYKKEMLRYSIPLIFNGIAWWMNSSLDKYFIIAMIGAGANGVYSVAYKIPTLLTMVQSIFNQAWNLSAIKEFDKNDMDGFFANTYSVYNAGIVIASSLLIVINIPIAKILFAKDFFEAWHYAPLLLLSTMFSALSGFIGSIFTAAKDSKVFAISTVSAALINAILNAILIPKYEIYGAAIATLISFFLIWIIRLLCSYKYMRWTINVKKDVVAYLLLVIQVIAAESKGNLYFVQGAILLILCILYLNKLKIIGKRMISILNKKEYLVL